MMANSKGFTLLEVLIALMIFTLGLLGLAGLLTVSIKTNHGAYLRTQATFLAQGMADRMRANPLGLWNGSYNQNTLGTSSTPTALTAAGTPTIGNCTASSCGYAAVAARDLAVFDNQLTTFLPNAGVAIGCTAPPTLTSAELLNMPPYAQTCEIQLTWTQLPVKDASATQAALPEFFDWVFQP
jgi:type IV pilus assembly protein PilV